MRVIDCECGAIVQAANDDELVERLRDHYRNEHGEELEEAEARRVVEERAYTAMDA